MTRNATSSKQLMRILATPSRVARVLDRERSIGAATIATLNVHADRIGVRISPHPRQSMHPRALSVPPPASPVTEPAPTQTSSYHSFPVSSKGRSKIPAATRRGLSELIHRRGVCGFVVSWPVQEDTGRVGAACGRTLFAIEELLRDTHGGDDGRSVFVPDRPLCLWDRNHRAPATADAFGRSPSYARGAPKPNDAASGVEPRRAIRPDGSISSVGVWEDFVRVHWPGLDRERREHGL